LWLGHLFPLLLGEGEGGGTGPGSPIVRTYWDRIPPPSLPHGGGDYFSPVPSLNTELATDCL